MDANGYGKAIRNGIIALAVLAAIAGGTVVGLVVWFFK